MDSKIVALDELTRLETETDEDVRQRLIKKAELEVAKKFARWPAIFTLQSLRTRH